MKNLNTIKLRIYLMAIFALIMIYQTRDLFIGNVELFIAIFLLMPVLIYYYVKYLWKKRKE